ncbi:MAG: FAD-dependent oxidoreductase, partial [Fimbriimonadales bacterium]|nr:FAD-dependent oxidoreductase [Fimbriimonadales bacterium]
IRSPRALMALLAEREGGGWRARLEEYEALHTQLCATVGAWAQQLRESVGIDIEWCRCGSLRVALHDSDAQSLRAAYEWVVRYDAQAQLLTAREARALEPALTEECSLALWLPNEGWVHTGRLMRALHAAVVQAGVEFYRGQPVVGFLQEKERITGVRVAGGVLRADAVVLAAGAWTGALLHTLGISVPIEPVRGQILVLGDLPRPVRHIVTSLIGYLVPRANGTVLLGATRERAGFDLRATAEGMHHLLQTLARLFPALMGATVVGHMVGLRPGTPDSNPLIGSVAGYERLYLASGHAYHGILLAPATAQAVADLVLNGSTELPVEPFNPARFLTP